MYCLDFKLHSLNRFLFSLVILDSNVALLAPTSSPFLAYEALVTIVLITASPCAYARLWLVNGLLAKLNGLMG